VCSKPNALARLRLFCFPYAGVGASLFGTWWKDLPHDVEVCAIQPPGRESRWKEPPLTRVGPVVEAVVEAIRPRLDLPFTFFGHSVGALIGFEVVRELRRRKEPLPVRLFVSARRAPQLPRRQPPIHHLPDPIFVGEMRRRYGGIPDAVLQQADLLQLMLPALRADVAIHETYAYVDEPPLACPISVFGGLADAEASRDDLEAWRRHTQSAFTLAMFPGDHFYVRHARAPLLRALSEALGQNGDRRR
jgi:medium-chain acyl-[acyl-carrier-protein] hydrolase